MGCLGLLVLIVISLPVFFLLIFFNIVTISFGNLGLSSEAAFILLVTTLIGSMINIPISHQRMVRKPSQRRFVRFFFYVPPQVRYQVITVNVGGAVVPVCFALYLLPQAAMMSTAVITVVVALVTKWLAKTVPGLGIVMPFWAPPLLSAGLALIFARENPAPAAYISGVLGTLIGADLLNWPNFKKLGAHVISIGGAGVFDGIFLTGVVAALIA